MRKGQVQRNARVLVHITAKRYNAMLGYNTSGRYYSLLGHIRSNQCSQVLGENDNARNVIRIEVYNNRRGERRTGVRERLLAACGT